MRDFLPALGHAPVGTTDDYLFMLRMDENAASSNLADEVGARAMTVVNNPGLETSLTGAVPGFINRGARSFDGSSQYAARTTGDDDHELLLTGRFGVSALIRMDGSAGTGRPIVGYGNTGSLEANNCLMIVDVLNDGSFRIFWEHGAGNAVVVSTAPGTIEIGTGRVHGVGWAIEPDPDLHQKWMARAFVDGRQVHAEGNLTPSSGGTNSLWEVGRSPQNTTRYWNGAIDDLCVTRWTPDLAWFRSVYAASIKTFEQRKQDYPQDRFAPFSAYHRVMVQVPLGGFSHLNVKDLEWVDLTDVHGKDFLLGASYGRQADELLETAEVRLRTSDGAFSLSPLVTQGPGATEQNALAEAEGIDPYTKPLLRPMARIRLESAYVPMGMSRADAEIFFEPVLDGCIRAVDPNEEETIVTVADVSASLLQTWIEPSKDGGDRQYGAALGSPIETELQKIIDENDPARFEVIPFDGGAIGKHGTGVLFAILHSFSVSVDTNGRGRPHTFVVGDKFLVQETTSFNAIWTVGTDTPEVILSSETVAGSPAPENTGIARAVPALGYKHFNGPPKLWVPASPSWSVFRWNEPASKGVLQALDDLVQGGIGWRVGMLWHPVRRMMTLALYDPRAVRGSFDLFDLLRVSRLSVSTAESRNVATLEFLNDAVADSIDERRIHVRSARDINNLRNTGRQACRMKVASDSLINMPSEAQTLVNTVIADVGGLPMTLSVETLSDSRPQVGDEVFISPLDLAPGLPGMFLAATGYASITGVRTEIRAQGRASTRLELTRYAAAPIVQSTTVRRRFGDLFSRRGAVKARGLSGPLATQPNALALGTLNGNRVVLVKWSAPRRDLSRRWRTTEVHMWGVISFTPSPTTLRAVVDGTSTLVELPSSGTWYIKIIHRDSMGNQGPVSAVKSVVVP